jgi:hypothetical protein
LKIRKGRSKDHLWKFVKYKGDMGIYAKCSCGFMYGCYYKKFKESQGYSFEILEAPDKLYPYCPYCGARKTRYEHVKEIDEYMW